MPAIALYRLLLLIVGGFFSLVPILANAQGAAGTPMVAVGPQYDSTHVYVAPEDLDRFA